MTEKQLRQTAIKIAIRHHFCEVDDNELEIHEALGESDDDAEMSEFQFLVWQPFESMSNGDLWNSVDALIEDITRSFK